MLIHWLLYFLLFVAMLAGLFVTLLNLPGLWLMVLAAAIYLAATHANFLGPRSLIAIAILALIADVVEFFAASALAKRAGAGRGGVWGAIIGAIVGGILLTGLVPIFIVGTIVGILVGTFIGAALGEVLTGKSVGGSLKVGVGATTGRVLGTSGKLLIGGLILLITLWTALPVGGRLPAAQNPASSRLTQQNPTSPTTP